MGLDQNLKQGSNGILDGLTAQPPVGPASVEAAASSVSALRQPLFAEVDDTDASSQPRKSDPPLAKTQNSDRTAEYHHQFRQPNSLHSSSGFSSVSDSSMTSSQRQVREEEQRERVEVHPLMGMGAATAPTQPVVSQSINYQMTKQRQLARSVLLDQSLSFTSVVSISSSR